MIAAGAVMVVTAATVRSGLGNGLSAGWQRTVCGGAESVQGVAERGPDTKTLLVRERGITQTVEDRAHTVRFRRGAVLMGKIRPADDQAHSYERRIGQPTALDKDLESAARPVVAQLRAADVEGRAIDAVDIPGPWYEREGRGIVDETADRPRRGDTVHVETLPRHEPHRYPTFRMRARSMARRARPRPAAWK
jgi:hypothetical protein